MQLSYLDFELEIGIGQGRDFPVVARSPAGEAREVMRFPYDEMALESRLKDLQIALLRSGGDRRQVLPPEQQAVRSFGQALFDALFSGEIRSRFDVSLQQARSQGKGLRIRLQAQSPTAAALPWEYLYDPRQSEYCALSVETPLVRFLELPQPITPLAVTFPLRMLGMVASPADLPGLDVGQEKQRIEQALKGLLAKGRLQVEWLPGQTWRDLQEALRHGPWHIFHFSGHGRFDALTDEGQLIFADDLGRARVMPANDVGRLLANHRTLRLVWLNACEGAQGGKADIFSSAASILVRRGIPAVVAMQHEITDRAAIELARTFYEAVADGYPVDAALAEARVATSLAVNNTVEWGTPALFMRAPDGILFDVEALAEGQPMRSETPPSKEIAVKSTQRSLWRVLAIAALAAAIGVFVLLASRAGLFPDNSQFRATETATAQSATILAATLVRNPTVSPPPAGGVAGTAMARPIPSVLTALANKVVTTDTGVRIIDPIQMDLVRVPAGEFIMGSDPQKDALASSNESPQHQVPLPEFFIGQYEVTNAQYAGFTKATGYRPPDDWENGNVPAGKENHPVVFVSWKDAVEFTRWLSDATGLTVRLPTEAEWEKACRGPNGLIYPWGDVFDPGKVNSVSSNTLGKTAPVGTYSPQGDSPYHLADMAGNVWEWTSSLERSYPYDAEDGREDARAAEPRVLRGGHFKAIAKRVRCAERGTNDPDIPLIHHGFRVVVVTP
jgi:formylglycine-generating enzyme required for sulfatase activity